MKNEMKRREFMKVAAVGAGGALALGNSIILASVSSSAFDNLFNN